MLSGYRIIRKWQVISMSKLKENLIIHKRARFCNRALYQSRLFFYDEFFLVPSFFSYDSAIINAGFQI